jgi:putative hemolysin
MWCWLILVLVAPAVPLSTWFEAQSWWPAPYSALLPSLILLSIPAAALNATFGQLVPTSLATQHPVDTCLRYGSAARFIAMPFVPAAKASVAIGGLITERFGAKAGFDLTNTATQQIINVLESAEESDEETTPELEMLDSVIEFTRSVAREVMTPRVDIVSISQDATIGEAADMVNEHRKSRLPVNAGTDDSILGAVHAKDILLAVTHGQSGEPVTAIMRPVIFVPETKPLQALLTEMQSHRAGLAIVQDEYGGTEGIVTTEDIVEEVLGDILDEHDRDEPILQPKGSGWTVGGKMNLEDLGHEIGIEIRSREFDTLGGYVFGLFGRQPEPGDMVDEEGLRFTILQTDGRRITQVHIEPLEAEAPISSG